MHIAVARADDAALTGRYEDRERLALRAGRFVRCRAPRCVRRHRGYAAQAAAATAPPTTPARHRRARPFPAPFILCRSINCLVARRDFPPRLEEAVDLSAPRFRVPRSALAGEIAALLASGIAAFCEVEEGEHGVYLARGDMSPGPYYPVRLVDGTLGERVYVSGVRA